MEKANKVKSLVRETLKRRRSKDENDFIDKHLDNVKVTSRSAEDDDIEDISNVEHKPRKADHAYGEDEMVYEGLSKAMFEFWTGKKVKDIAKKVRTASTTELADMVRVDDKSARRILSKPKYLEYQFAKKRLERMENGDLDEALPKHLEKHFDKDGNKKNGKWVEKNGKKTWVPLDESIANVFNRIGVESVDYKRFIRRGAELLGSVAGIRFYKNPQRDGPVIATFNKMAALTKFTRLPDVYDLMHVNEEMTDDQKDKREKIVKSLKKKKDEFQNRYGDDWENVMYATATKMATESKDIFGEIIETSDFEKRAFNNLYESVNENNKIRLIEGVVSSDTEGYQELLSFAIDKLEN